MGNKGDNNRQRIVAAADQLFYKRGYNQTSFRDISEETGIPRGNFYYYFKTKEEILSAVIDTRLNTFSAMLEECEQRGEDPRQRIICFTELLSTMEDSLLQVGCPVGTLSSELAKDDDANQEMSRAVFKQLREWASRQYEEMGVASADEKAMDLLARMQGVTVMACAFNDREFLRHGLEDIKNWVNNQTLS